jgi:hypothetical protein
MRWSPPVELSPTETRLCDRLSTHRRFFRFLRLHRHRLLDDAFQDQLTALYADKPRGTPPKPPAQLVLAVLLQAYTKASDEDVIDELHDNARWRMVLDVRGTKKAPFGKTTFVDFRRRLVESGMGKALLARTVALAKETRDFGYKQAAGLRIALDSAPLEGAGKVEDTLNLLGHALRLLVVVVAAFLGQTPERIAELSGLTLLSAPSLKAALDLDWSVPDAKNVALRLVTAQIAAFEAWWQTQKPAAMVPQTVAEAQALLDRLRAQDTEVNDQGQEQIRQGVAPDRQISISDPEMRHGRKHKTQRIDGYKKYSAVDEDNTLTVAAGVLAANVPEAQGADKLKPDLEAQGPLAGLDVDRAFLPSQLVREAEAQGVEVRCRAPNPTNQGRFPKSAFEVDLGANTVRCPQGKLAVISGGRAQFASQECKACPQRVSCQKEGAKQGRSIAINEQEEMMQRLRAREKTKEGRAALRKRTVVEHVQAHHCRRQGPMARYSGVAKNDYDVQRIAAVGNLLEIDRREREAQRARAITPQIPEAALTRPLF